MDDYDYIRKIDHALEYIQEAMLKNMEETKFIFEGKPASMANVILNDAWNELNDIKKHLLILISER